MDTASVLQGFMAVVLWFLLFVVGIKTRARIFYLIGVLPIFFFALQFSEYPFLLFTGIFLILFQLWFTFWGDK